MDLVKYTFEPAVHRGKKVILIRFPYDQTLQAALRKRFSLAKWSATQKKAWYLPDLPVVRLQLGLAAQNGATTSTVLPY